MSATAAPHPATPDPAAPFRRAISALLAFGRDLRDRIQGAQAFGTTTHIPRRLSHDLARAEQGISNALEWAFALARTLAGDRYYLPQPATCAPPARTPSPPTHPAPRRSSIPVALGTPWTHERRAAAVLRTIRTTFAATPTHLIARAIARRLGIRENSDFWPTELLAITEPPAAWADRAEAAAPAASSSWFAPPSDQPAHPHPPSADPPFHRRE